MMGVSVTMDTRSHLLAGFQHNMDDMTRIPPQHCAKVFIQRDYSEGTAVRFQNKFPSELEGKIERQAFEYTINQLNSMYIEAETLSSRTYCESCFACLTAYLAYLCMETHYEKMLKKIARFVQDQNNSVYIPRGLMLIDPAERGLRIVTPFGYSACIFASIKMFPSNSSVSQTYFGSFSLVPSLKFASLQRRPINDNSVIIENNMNIFTFDNIEHFDNAQNGGGR